MEGGTEIASPGAPARTSALPGGRGGSVGLALAAAFGWATYYLFVLWDTPGTAASALLVYPFLIGGGALALWAIAAGHGRAFAHQWISVGAYLRTGLLVALQIAILAATYLTGPVDASLLSLIGDVIATPLVAAALFAGTRPTVGRPLFLAGLLLSLAGGSIAIVGGRSVDAVHGLGWLAVVVVPTTVGFYFILAARASETVPNSAVVAQSFLGAGLVTLLFVPFFPGGWGGLGRVDAVAFGWIAANGLVSFFAAPALYFLAIRREGLVLPPMLMTAIPIFTLLLSVGVLKESVPWLGLVGIPIAVVGGLLTLRSVAREPALPERARQ